MLGNLTLFSAGLTEELTKPVCLLNYIEVLGKDFDRVQLLEGTQSTTQVEAVVERVRLLMSI